MKSQSKLGSKEHEQQAAEQQAGQTAAKEFGTVEELLKYDAQQTEVPPKVAERLEESVRKEPAGPAPRSWWRRFFGQ
jgi:hypothetical protein